jgi:hypothetical protein
MRYTRTLSISAFVGLALPLWLSLGCGEDKEGQDEAAQSMLVEVDVCAAGGPLAGQCGGSCEETSNCPSGQFCDDDVCVAECSAERGCIGTCTAEGRCEGQRETVVVAPGQSEGDPIISDPSDTPVTGDFASCATDQADGQLTPVVMYVMFDRSSSMNDNDKWNLATAALQSFFRDPASANLGIAYGAFPTETGGCDMDVCDVAVCERPLVPIGTLAAADADPHEVALIDAVEQDEPSGGGLGTPIGAALQGALNWGETYQAGHVGESAVVVLVTDGEPQGCGDINEISDIAAQGLTANGIRTYAIGLEGSREGDMDRIAEAGGTGEGIFIGEGDTNADLLAALNTIRGEAASCEVQVPNPASGTIDPSKINVELSLSGEPVALGQVATVAECGDNGAWYYDNPATPSSILLCPATCDAVQADPMSRIEIVLGCVTSSTLKPIR